MNRSPYVLGAALALATVFSFTAPAVHAATSTVTCKDGTTSKGGKGACSSHGGVDKGAAAKTKAAPAAKAEAAGSAAAPKDEAAAGATASAKPEKAAPAAAGQATAKCKDGTMSHAKNHSGACSKHGGVAQWLDGT